MQDGEADVAALAARGSIVCLCCSFHRGVTSIDRPVSRAAEIYEQDARCADHEAHKGHSGYACVHVEGSSGKHQHRTCQSSSSVLGILPSGTGRARLTKHCDGQTIQMERHVCPSWVWAVNVCDWVVQRLGSVGSGRSVTSEARLCPGS